MIAIVDYGVGNLFSLKSSFAAIGADVTITSERSVIDRADRIILPGVGAFADAAEKLRASGLDEYIVKQTQNGKLLMGICLGMQLLFDKSLEYGEHAGLGLIHGVVKPIADVIPKGLKIPQIGWNGLNFKKESRLFSGVKEGDCVYFVHSYYAADCDNAVIATTEYGAPITAAVGEKNVFGCQFHPEKSGAVGLEILKAFSTMKEAEIC